ncbi:MAG: TonB-dependent receptor [Holophagales bacterium]|nr:TonB-dependent receptor [Holophagales bacterium]
MAGVRSTRTRSHLVVVLFLVLGLAWSGPSLAALTGSVSGFVRDETGGPLPGVGVTLTGPALQGSRTAVTKGDGSYVFVNVPPGRAYRCAFALSGFTKVEKTGFDVSVDKDTQVHAALRLAAVGAEVVVLGEAPVVDITRTNTQASFDADYLRKATIGSAGRDYLSVVGQTPGAVGQGNSRMLGGNSQQNSFTIDGINTTDPVTHTFTYNLNFDSIQEVSVQSSSYEAQYGRAVGGIVNVVTKSGGNDFSATADFRYSSNDFSEKGDFFDPNVTRTKTIQPSATLGGPVLKDRLWFFGNYEHPLTKVQPSTTNAAVLAENPSAPSRDFTGDNFGLKLTFTLSDRINGFLNYQNSTATIEGAENSVLTRPEASQSVDQGGALLKGKVSIIASPELLLEVQGGFVGNFLDAAPANGDLARSRWTNRLTGVRYDSYNTSDETDRPRTLVGASGTWFVNDALGNHQVKAGFDADWTAGDRTVFTTGTPSDPSFCPQGLACGATFSFNGFDPQGNRIPFQQIVSERQGLSPRTGQSWSAYLQDQWRPTSRLTFNVGLRYDRTQQDNNLDATVVDFDKVQPRLSAAWDPKGDGKNVVRASYGIFYDEPALTLVRLLSSGVVTPIQRDYRWSVAQGRWNLNRETGGTVNPTGLIDPDIKPTYQEQIAVAAERELWKNGRVALTYIYKKAHDIYEDTCMDEECSDFLVTNQPGAFYGLEDVLRSDYFGYILEASQRFSRGVVTASYTYSKARGSIDSTGGQFGGADFDHYPENFVNRFGYLPADVRHSVKVFANYQIPYIETALGVNYTYRTGLAYDVTRTDPDWGAEYLEPRGTNRTAVLHVLDLNLEKAIPLPFVSSRAAFSLIGSVFNVLNTEQPLTYGGAVEAQATYKKPLTYQRPRNYQVGVRFEF